MTSAALRPQMMGNDTKAQSLDVPVYSVATMGFNPVERSVLGSIFGLSARRNPRFVPFVVGGPAIAPDLFMIDVEDPRCMDALKAINTKYHGKARVLMIGNRPAIEGHLIMPRPLLWTRTLKMMEEAMLGGAQADKPTRKTERVLVVDDALPVRKFMEAKLAPFGFDVDYAETGEQAIGMSGEKQYTCVFLDVILPGVDGYQVCKMIKSKKRTGKTPAVVMLTSKNSTFDKIRGSMAGCDAYLTKPVDEEKLLETIAKFLPVTEATEVAV